MARTAARQIEPASTVHRLASGLFVTGGDAAVIARAAQVAKATSDYGAFGDAMADNAISSALSNEYRSWQQSALRDAAIHWWLYKNNPWVRTCVDLIAQRATADDYGILSASEDATGVEALRVYLDRINPKQSLNRLLRGIYRDLGINANWYGRVQFQGTTPVAIYRIDFRTIVPKPEAIGAPQVYHLFANGRSDHAPREIPAAEVLHLTLNDAGENGCGLSELESLDGTLANDQAAIAYNTGFFQNGAKAGDIYQMDPALGPDQVDREREYLKENFTKPSQSFEPLLLQGKTALLRDGASIRKDMEFVKLREWNREEVCAVFSVPLSLVTGQVGQLGANGKETDNIVFKEAVIAPLQKQVFEDLNRELVQGRLGNADLTLVPPKVAGVRLDLVQAAREMISSGATGNEARGVMHLDPIEGLEEPLYLGGRNTSLVGVPGSEDAILLTNTGAVAAKIQDPTDTASPVPAGETEDQEDDAEAERAQAVQKAEATYTFGSTQLNLPPVTGGKIVTFGQTIPAEDLAEDGRETEPHITVTFGLRSTGAAVERKLRRLCAAVAPIAVRFGKTSLFPAADPAAPDAHDVVKVDVESEALRRLNAAIEALLDTEPSTHAYSPHATVAYVKAGRGKAYAGATILDGGEATLDTLALSRRDGTKVLIPLTGEPEDDAGLAVSKAGHLHDDHVPDWLHEQAEQLAAKLIENAGGRRRHLARVIGANA